MKVSWDKIQNYNRIYISGGGEVYVRHDRTIREAESLLIKLCGIRHSHYHAVVKPILEQIQAKGGKAHCKTDQSEEPWISYRVSDDDGYGLSIGDRKIKTPPTSPINLDLGQKYYEANKLTDKFCGRDYRVRAIFSRLLSDWLWADGNRPERYGSVLKLDINGRPYYFVADHNEYSVLHWKKLSEPGEEIIERSV